MDAVARHRFLVTGASGFLGQHVVALLRDGGADVHTLHMTGATPADIRAAVETARPQRVIHLAGFTDIGASWNDVAGCFDANVGATLALLAALKGSGCERLVFASTADVYGDAPVPFREDGPVQPLSPYAVSKFAAERLCLLAARTGGPPAVVVRPFNAYGPGQPSNRVVADVILTALRGEDVAMTEGLQEREFNYVTDMAEGIVAAAITPGIDGEVINLGCGESITIRAIAETVLDVMGNPVKPRFGVKPERPVEVPVVVADTHKAERLLGWRPRRPLRDGLAETVAWHRSFPLSLDA